MVWIGQLDFLCSLRTELKKCVISDTFGGVQFESNSGAWREAPGDEVGS